MLKDIRYSVVVPCYNEEEVIRVTHQRLTEVMQKTRETYEIIYVNDGSRDQTAEIINELAQEDEQIRLINFSRNFGHQAGVTAGLNFAQGQAIVIIDADLQDPPEVILEMIYRWKQGYDVIYGKRLKRQGETIFKRLSALAFYRIMTALSPIQIPEDTGDFRLIDRKVCDVMNSLTEKNRYIRGLVSWIGFKQIAVEFNREERFAGETKYPLRKMLKLAFDGITSFSYKPLKIATYLGFGLSGFSFVYLVIVLFQKFFFGGIVAGWASSVAINLFFHGITLMILGIMGEYIGRIYDESKNRPIYIVRSTIGYDQNEVSRTDALPSSSAVPPTRS